MSRDDDGHFLAVEAMLVAVLLFAAVAFLLYLPLPGDHEALAAASSADRAGDVLRVLAGTPGTAGYDSQLEELVSRAVVGDTSGMARVKRLLPEGAGFGVYLDNGVAPRALYESGRPTGTVESRDEMLYPDWDQTFAFADLEGHAATSASDTMRIRAFVLHNSYLDRTSHGVLLYENGVSVPVTRDAAGALVTALVPPKTGPLEGYATPYDLADFNASVASHALQAPVPFTVRTSLLDAQSGTAYRVHPSFAIDAGLRSYANAGGHTSIGPAEVHPGEAVTLTYDFSGLPGGATVLGRAVTVHGPAPGFVAASADLGAATGAWSWTVPRDALYGTYVVDTRVVLASGGLQQVVHDVTTFDVLRPGTTAPTPPVYRVVVALWFNSM